MLLKYLAWASTYSQYPLVSGMDTFVFDTKGVSVHLKSGQELLVLPGGKIYFGYGHRLVRAVVNAAIVFQILPRNVWSQEAARIKQPGMKIPKKNTRYSGVLHAIPHYARLKASEVLLLSPRWSS